MGKRRLIVLAHGIGDASTSFYENWRKVLDKNHDLADATVVGLAWEDVLEKVQAKYPLVSDAFAEIVEMCGFPNLKKWVGNSSWKDFQDYAMDVLAYAGLPDMWTYIQDECALRLDGLRNAGPTRFDESECILIGHSLGAAMLPQLAWREYAATSSMKYRGMILLASPLGFESPYPRLCKDFLQRMGELFGWDRLTTLAQFARAWDRRGPGRLRFISNENDIVCSDVKYVVPKVGLVDLIPLRQGFNPAEAAVLDREHEGCVQTVSFGKRLPSQIADNHDVLTYLGHPAFIEALDELL